MQGCEWDVGDGNSQEQNVNQESLEMTRLSIFRGAEASSIGRLAFASFQRPELTCQHENWSTKMYRDIAFINF